ncbi:DEKNAAC104810 [Brettanomyces naardenensis]|uniref:DEKNAAC104810 n=1 Tax=Brettanomyces naardenensis TaxID=13370 RepID=A0A448YSC0_BRENA|nr:DEKNAAC104810 [Brettanomyces naardenensis]
MPHPEAPHSASPLTEDDNFQLSQLNRAIKTQNFWKYHIMRLNPFEFYLTTNPDNRHKLTRHAPSYYVSLQIPESSKEMRHMKQAAKGFRLTFTQQQWRDSDETSYPSFTVEKLSDAQAGGYKVSCFCNEHEVSRRIENIPRKQEISPSSMVFDNIAVPTTYYGDEMSIDSGYKLGNRLKVCTLKQKKRNYFFKTKIDGVKLAKEGSAYFLDEELFRKDSWYSAVVAIFRPCKREITSKFAKKVATSSSNMTGISSLKVRSSTSSSRQSGGEDSDSDATGDDYDMEYTTYNDQSTSVKYYIARDGLHDRHPQDDSPNDYKLGWITIYDRDGYFESGTKGGGNWEVVLGMTFAVGFEGSVDRQLKE